MVTGIERPMLMQKETFDYRKKVGALNQSMLKVYDNDPMDFYTQFVLGERKEEKDTFATLVGSVAEFLLLECKCDELIFDQKADEQFAIYNGTKGGGQVYLLADYMFEEYLKNSELELEMIIRSAFSRIQAEDKYKKKTVEYAADDLTKKDGEGNSALDYYYFKVGSVGKRVIDNLVIGKAKEVAQMLKNDSFTRDLFDFAGDEYQFSQRFVKYPLIWKYNGIECKSEFDQWWLNPVDGWAMIDDLKCTYDNEMFDYSYIKNGYYIQNGFYVQALRWWLDENGMQDVEIRGGVRFIVGDTSKNKRRPLVYNTSLTDVDKALNGFTLRGVKYKGVFQLMEEVGWAMENGIFNCNMENYKAEGQLNLNIRYE